MDKSEMEAEKRSRGTDPKRVAEAFWFVPVFLLVVAVLPLPYEYYTFLRIVISLAAALFVWTEFEQNGAKNLGYLWLFLGIGLLYNPVAPVYLNKPLWVVLNLGAAGVFMMHYVKCNERK